ncbi:MAG: hypothetical protein DPW09_43965 [Anaerolineae bacterium]|nr:hypothetical protein [Anaerolineae bacterium]
MKIILTLNQTTPGLKHLWRSALMLALLTLLCWSFPAAQADTGDLDTTFAGFGSNGLVTPPGLKDIYDIAFQPDGRIVLVGYTGILNQLAVYRYLPDGRLDPSFGSGGKAIFADMFGANAIALQSDGGIVVGGGGGSFQLARLTPGGALDPSFDGDGWAQDVDPQLKYLHNILVQLDGKIVACGTAEVGGDSDFGVTRYTSGGARDTTFGGGDGKVTIPFGDSDYCNDIVQQNDGKLVVAGLRFDTGAFGDDNNDIALARLESDGTLDDNSNGDGGFDGDGKLTTDFGGEEGAETVVLQPDGKIVVVDSYRKESSYIVRYLPSGALDGAFGSGGKITILYDSLRELALQSDGKLLVLGYHKSSDGDFNFALHRLLPNGNPDNTFDSDGIARPDFGGADSGRALALQPDGRILAAGTKSNAAGLLIRLWPDGSLDTGGQQTHSLTFAPSYQAGYLESAYGMALQPNGAFLVAGQVYNPQATVSDAFVTRFTPNGLPDTSFGTNGSAGRMAAPSSLALACLEPPPPWPSNPTAKSSSPVTPPTMPSTPPWISWWLASCPAAALTAALAAVASPWWILSVGPTKPPPWPWPPTARLWWPAPSRDHAMSGGSLD